jgi:hypothetical protein
MAGDPHRGFGEGQDLSEVADLALLPGEEVVVGHPQGRYVLGEVLGGQGRSDDGAGEVGGHPRGGEPCAVERQADVRLGGRTQPTSQRRRPVDGSRRGEQLAAVGVSGVDPHVHLWVCTDRGPGW